jgi:hypothetical protein
VCALFDAFVLAGRGPPAKLDVCALFDAVVLAGRRPPAKLDVCALFDAFVLAGRRHFAHDRVEVGAVAVKHGTRFHFDRHHRL